MFSHPDSHSTIDIKLEYYQLSELDIKWNMMNIIGKVFYKDGIISQLVYCARSPHDDEPIPLYGTFVQR